MSGQPARDQDGLRAQLAAMGQAERGWWRDFWQRALKGGKPGGETAELMRRKLQILDELDEGERP